MSSGILKGYITLMEEGGKYAQVEALGKIYDRVLMLYPYGMSSNIKLDDSSMVLLLKNMGSDDTVFGIPYNAPLQSALEPAEAECGNLKDGNKITFKNNGDIEISATTGTLKELVKTLDITASTNMKVTSPDINLTGATKVTVAGPLTEVTSTIVKLGLGTLPVLNTAATMTVDTTTSNPVQPVVITAPGQTAVLA